MRRLLMFVAAAAVFAVAGCAASDAGPGAPVRSTASLPSVQIVRTGGIAGVRDVLGIDPDGRWTYTSRASSSGTGQLDESAKSRLGALLNDPGLPAAVDQATPDPRCADQFEYELSVGPQTYSFDECHGLTPPLSDLLALLNQTTPF